MNHYQAIRLYEIEYISSFVPPKSKILEIGAGSGFQSDKLSKKGFTVEAIDLDESISKHKQEFYHVVRYDGFHIPFPDNSFDIIFSSNVQEHIPHIRPFQSEIKRVLKSNGSVIHILPSGTWRLWSNICHYFIHPKKILIQLNPKKKTVDKYITEFHPSTLDKHQRNSTISQRLIKAFIPNRHGAHGNFLTEIYIFSRLHWMLFFNNTGWEIEKVKSNKLFYTGVGILGTYLPINYRKLFRYFLGSSCYIYILKTKNKD